ncbi:MAG: hypothetical protein OXI26_10210 [bacterium]|nr:hypothetical protein [bacterium]
MTEDSPFGKLFENQRAFEEKYESDLLAEHTGRFALMCDGELFHVFDTDDAAIATGYRMRLEDGSFTSHRIGAPAARLGATFASM